MELTLDRVNYIPVHILLKKITDSCDRRGFDIDAKREANARAPMSTASWIRMMRNKSLDDSFWGLLDIIPVEGFRVPICVNVDPDGKWTMGNGHHRLTADILLVLDEIPVYLASDDHVMHSEFTDPDRGDGINPYPSSDQTCGEIDQAHALLWKE